MPTLKPNDLSLLLAGLALPALGASVASAEVLDTTQGTHIVVEAGEGGCGEGSCGEGSCGEGSCKGDE